MDLKIFTSAISQITEEKGIPYDKVIETIETAIAAAYKKDYGKKGQIIKAKLVPETGEVKFWQVKLVVDKDMILSEEEIEELKNKKIVPGILFEETEGAGFPEKTEAEGEKKIRFNPERHILLEDAQKTNPDIKTKEELTIPLETQKDYGRIAAQTAKQVILQKLREVEKETVFAEYKSKEGEVISGIIQKVEGNNVFLDIGKVTGVMPQEEQIYREFYRIGQRIKIYLLRIEKTPRGPIIILSRAHPKMISKLFELEVPEISAGQVEIKSIAREPGSRTKIAVLSKEKGVDAIGATVGQRGVRVSAVINELGGEKIDIIEWSDAAEKFIANALSPAKVAEVRIEEDNKAVAFVSPDQISLAIGKDGQNVRLAVKLTGWKIDVKSVDISQEEKKSEEGAEKTEAGKSELAVPEKAVVEEKAEEKKESEKTEVKKESKKGRKKKTENKEK